MQRRTFLLGTGAIASQLLAGCNSPAQATLQVQFLRGSIPAIVFDRFRQQAQQAKFTPVAQLQELFTQLQAWQQAATATNTPAQWFLPTRQAQSPNPADLVTLGDYWLAAAIAQKLIQPLDVTQLQAWNRLPESWQTLVRRNPQGQPDAQGQIWAAPYRWGSTVIAYNREKFRNLSWTPQDWSDLWRPELRDRVSVLNHSREVIGLTLKRLNQSYNTQNLNTVPDLEPQLRLLHQQIKLYSSSAYIEPLLMGDTWVAVGWSTEILPVLRRYQQIAAVIPQSGTALSADLWVNPVNERVLPTLAAQWIDFCWQPQIAQQLAQRSYANSPIPVELAFASVPPRARNVLIAEPQRLQQSEFLLPLPPATQQQYNALWQKIRT